MHTNRERLANFKDILNNLSSIHACCTEGGNANVPKHYDFHIMSQKYINIMEKYVQECENSKGIHSLLKSIKDVLERDDEYLFVETKHYYYPVTQLGATVPLVFDLLLTIFYNTVTIERQYLFHDIIEYYYGELKKKIELEKIFKRENFDYQINMFLPLVKLEYLHLLNQNQKNVDESKSIIRELNEHILYPNLSRQDCYEIVRNYLFSNDYEFIEYKITVLGNVIGYLGQYFRVIIKVLFETKERYLYFFAKSLPKTCLSLMSMATATFKKEEFIYRNFFQMVQDYGFSDILDFSVKCYFARCNDIIVLEDLTQQNYKCSHPRIPAEHDHMITMIKQLAKFHACSLILEEKLSESSQLSFRIGEQFAEFLQEINLSYLGSEGAINKHGARLVVKYMLDKFPDICQNITMNEFKQLSTEEFKKMYEHVRESKEYRNVICHGDLWTSNILTRRDKDQKIISCRIVDYQIIRYCPPTVDLLFLIYVNTNKSLREQFLPEFMSIYYKQLSNILSKYNIDINNIYDNDTFSRCIEDMTSTCICQALCYLQVLLIPKEKSDILMNNPETAEHFLTVERTEYYEREKIWEDEMFRRRIKELIEDLYDVCTKYK